MRLLCLATLFVYGAHAGPIGIAEVGGFLHGNGGLIAQLDDSSSGYFTTLDANSLGTFGWTFTNTSPVAINNALFLLFLDADIDAATNTYFNEYGTLLALALPPSAPAGAIAASSWEIDEPGFVFGDIFNHLLLGALDNTNGVPVTSPDDVSLALGFLAGTIAPGQTLRVTGTIALANIAGLSQTDPDSNYTFFFNGFATLDQVPSGDVPEPRTCWPLLALTVGTLARFRLRPRG